jgi:lipoyl(octanoyl) transferase
MTTSQIIRHIHLPNITLFAHATAIQNILVRQNLDYKALSSYPGTPSPLPPAPTPTILSFSPTPVYTTGRRELGTLSQGTIAELREPLPILAGTEGGLFKDGFANGYSPEVKETLRGGQITFHGPGQLVIYPILDLKAVKSEKWPKGLTARCFVNVLEQATINTLKGFGIIGFRTENPGVWVTPEKKIAALGLHMRRNITSFGVGLNIKTDLRYFDKIVACGLEGKRTTSIKQELWGGKSAKEWKESMRRGGPREKALVNQLSRQMQQAQIARRWAKEFGELVWGEEGRIEMLKTSKAREIAAFLDEKESRGDIAAKKVVKRYYISDPKETGVEREDTLLLEETERNEDDRTPRDVQDEKEYTLEELLGELEGDGEVRDEQR